MGLMSVQSAHRAFLAAAALLFLIGLAMRLEGIASSLWVDEFGTLWVIESGVRDTISRSVQVQGQAPLYYLVAWSAVRLFGESEAVLRVVSIAASAGATCFVGLASWRLGGRWAALTASVLLWYSADFIATSCSVRPYALGYLFGALGILGFVLVCTSSGGLGRVAFVVGLAGLWWTHFLLAPMAAGLVLAWILAPALRSAYRPKAFLADLALIGALTVPTLPQLGGLFGRRSAIAWASGDVNWSVLAPLLPFGFAAALCLALSDRSRRWSSTTSAVVAALLLTVVDADRSPVAGGSHGHATDGRSVSHGDAGARGDRRRHGCLPRTSACRSGSVCRGPGGECLGPKASSSGHGLLFRRRISTVARGGRGAGNRPS